LEEKMQDAPFLNGQPFRAAILIPESHVFTSSFLLPADLKRDPLHNVSLERAQKDIPLPFKDAEVALTTGKKIDGQRRVTVHAVQRGVVQGLRGILDPDHFELKAMESNTKALERLVDLFGIEKLEKGEEDHQRLAIVDVGHSWATLSVYTPAGLCVFSRSLAYREIEADLDEQQGVALDDESIEKILEMVEQIIDHFSEDAAEIACILFAGVEASQDAFKEVLKEQENKEEPYDMHTIGDMVEIDSLSSDEMHTYGAAIGAAVRAAKPRKFNHHHNFVL
jgi:Tfp pilus assembly PilM family ATPase